MAWHALHAEAVADVGKAQEKLLNKRAMALQKRDASLKKIQVGASTRLDT